MYSKLSETSPEIRILCLYPGSPKDELHCSLSIFTLQQAHDSMNVNQPETHFEALSYVWGKTKSITPIQVQGQPMQITENLESALRHLRYQDKHRYLWVDAVCIDQENMEERPRQVSMMGIIYRSAERVVVWLGTEVRQSSLDIIKCVGSHPDRHWDSTKHSDTHPNFGFSIFLLYFFFRDTEWYQRIWTLQETVLAKSVTYICGLHVFANGELDGFIRSFILHFSGQMCCNLNNVTMVVGMKNLAGLMGPFVNQMTEMVYVADNRGTLPFLDIASKFRHRQATDPRDKVFGLLDLTHDVPKDIISYKYSVADIYAKATMHIIAETRNLDVLSHVLPPSLGCMEHGKDTELPSWAPDWSDFYRFEYWRLRSVISRQSYAGFFNACGQNSTPYWHKSSDSQPMKLILNGFQCGTICQMGSSCRPSNGKDSGSWEYNVLAEWREMLNVDREPEQVYRPIIDREQGQVSSTGMLDAFWRTLFANIDPQRSEPNKTQEADGHTRDVHDKWWWDCLVHTKYKKMPGAGRQLDEHTFQVVADHVIQMTAGRKFVMSDTGLIGIASENVQPGDQIWVLNGGKVPLILRPRADAQREENHDNEYLLVGDSYVHGIMNGEFVDGKDQPTTVILV